MGSLEAFAAQLPQLEVLAEQLYTATVSCREVEASLFGVDRVGSDHFS